MKRTVTMLVCDSCDAATEKKPGTPGLLIQSAKLTDKEGSASTYRDVYLCQNCTSKKPLGGTLTELAKPKKPKAPAKKPKPAPEAPVES